MSNPYFPIREKEDWVTTLVMTGFYAVDLFLIIGGYVSILFVSKAFTEFKDSKLWKLPVLYLFMVLKRYMRMMPV